MTGRDLTAPTVGRIVHAYILATDRARLITYGPCAATVVGLGPDGMIEADILFPVLSTSARPHLHEDRDRLRLPLAYNDDVEPSPGTWRWPPRLP